MSQVKNLRAMFEQKQDASPPEKGVGSDRGRSPVDSAGTATPPPRPLSKVRTNFVAVVEKDGRVGLRRDPSSDSIPTTRSLSQRRLSTNTEEGSASVTSERTSSMALASEPIPESPRQPEIKSPAPTRSFNLNGTNGLSTKLGALSDRPSLNPDKHIDLETPTPKLLPGDPTDIPPPQPLAPAKPSTTNAVTGTPKQTTKASSAAHATPKSAAAKPPSKLQPVSTTKTAGKPPAKSPSLPKTPTGTLPKSVSQPLPVKSHLPKKATEKTTTPKAATPAKSAATKPAASSSTTAATKKVNPAPVSIPTSSSTGFVKPKVKSPTRPVNLPSSLMAGTASSQSKVKDGSRDSLAPRTSGLGRSPSRASVSTLGADTGKTIRRQRSTINHPRPSLGPPPKKIAEDHPVVKKERDVDEGFLARMARPTLSSASKVSEKAPVTPPRKHVVKKESSTTRPSSTATSAKKAGAHSAHAATGSPDSKKQSTNIMSTGDDAPEVSKIEEEEVEEALRNATKIPEVAEPVEAPSLAAAPEALKIDEQTLVEAPVEAESQPEPEPETKLAEAAPETVDLPPVVEEPKAAEPIHAAEETEVKPEAPPVEESKPAVEDDTAASAEPATNVVQDGAIAEDAKGDNAVPDAEVEAEQGMNGTAQVDGTQEFEALFNRE